jgi:hypothetical protein
MGISLRVILVGGGVHGVGGIAGTLCGHGKDVKLAVRDRENESGPLSPWPASGHMTVTAGRYRPGHWKLFGKGGEGPALATLRPLTKAKIRGRLFDQFESRFVAKDFYSSGDHVPAHRARTPKRGECPIARSWNIG